MSLKRRYFLSLPLLFVLFFLKINVGFSQSIVGPRYPVEADLTDDGVCDNDPYVLVFEDEFTTNALDNSKWTAYVGTHGDPAAEQEYYVANNVLHGLGGLYLWTTNVGVTDPNTGHFYPYSSGEITSNFVFGYGLYEINCMIPSKEGLWPAFWARDGDPDQEIDGFEFFDNYSAISPFATFNDPNMQTPRFNDINGPTFSCPWPGDVNNSNPSYSAAFHTFDFEYDNYKIIWSVDGTPIRYSAKFSNLLSQPVACNDLKVADSPYLVAQEFPFPPLGIVANVAVSGSPHGPSFWSDDYAMIIQHINYYQQIPCTGADVVVSPLSLNSNPNFFNVFLGPNVTVDGNVNIPSQGALEIIASNSIVLQAGFSSNGYYVGQISSDPCSGIHRSIKKDAPPTNSSNTIQNENLNSCSLTKSDLFNLTIFPVPADNSTTISFYLYSPASVSIKIEDILGHQVLNILNAENLPSGDHSQVINVSNLPPGVYICTLIANGNLEQKKLIIERP